ncbi:hypothetical protein [Schaalia sp. lx-100]|uniref:hypothetical protein n=1 Tax=Schaalia sp. lx-100 TaxID=2899081 RepID=UPI001E3EA216|nr:hypothetical protein [Schaalia sp. lx-100]MCD4557095.1 hypothetical protein [Schaalia sp. lx-100]
MSQNKRIFESQHTHIPLLVVSLLFTCVLAVFFGLIWFLFPGRHLVDAEPTTITSPQSALSSDDFSQSSVIIGEKPTETDSAASGDSPAHSAEEITEVITAIENSPEKPETLIDSHTADFYGTDLTTLFPQGTTIKVIPDSWTDIDEVTAMVGTVVTYPNKEPEYYSAILSRIDEAWKLLGTIPLETPPQE